MEETEATQTLSAHTAEPFLLSQELLETSPSSSAQSLAWCSLHLPKKPSPLGVRVRSNQMPYFGCLYCHPCCLWIPRLLCFPLGMHSQVHIIKSPLWCTLWQETKISPRGNEFLVPQRAGQLIPWSMGCFSVKLWHLGGRKTNSNCPSAVSHRRLSRKDARKKNV